MFIRLKIYNSVLLVQNEDMLIFLVWLYIQIWIPQYRNDSHKLEGIQQRATVEIKATETNVGWESKEVNTEPEGKKKKMVTLTKYLKSVNSEELNCLDCYTKK